MIRKNVYYSHARKATTSVVSQKDVECIEDPNLDSVEPNVRELAKDEDDKLILQKLADKHYSYAAAITFSVGCLLLILNMLIFIAIYYQRQVSSSSRIANSKRRILQVEPPTPQPPDLMQPTASVPSYYIATDCDIVDFNRFEKSLSKDLLMSSSASYRELNVATSTSTVATSVDNVKQLQQQATPPTPHHHHHHHSRYSEQKQKQQQQHHLQQQPDQPTEQVDEVVALPQRTGILLKHNSASNRDDGTLRPKKRVQIQTDVSIV